MKLPSLHSLINKSSSGLTRFSLSIILAIVGSVFCMMILHLNFQEQESHPIYRNSAMTCYLGMLLFISIRVYAERALLGATSKLFFQLGGLIALCIYCYLLPDHFTVISTIKFVLFTIGLHLLISFAPFVYGRELNGFWQYNKILFLRMLSSALYSSVLFLGLALAILAIDQLFTVHMSEKIYGDLWIFMAGIFNTWYFLAGFPIQVEQLEKRTGYPKALKIFTQYVLLPLITVYLLILYAYMLKIILTAQWPVGWVSYLVLGFSIAGILSLLLIYPIRNEEENTWIPVYSRFYYVALFPLVVLLFLAIKKRVDEYGITENRYFILVLACWLTCIAAYFLLSKIKNIKLIPVTLCLTAFLTSFGPWGAFEVSLRSQKKHLVEILERNKMIAGNKVIVTPSSISIDDQREISSVVEYLTKIHGYQSLQPLFLQNLDSLMHVDSTNGVRHSNEEVNKILGLMNITYIKSQRQGDSEDKMIDLRSATDSCISIAGYHYFISDFNMSSDDPKDTSCSSYKFGKSPILVCFDSKKNLITLNHNSDSALVFDVALLVKAIKEKKDVDFQQLKTADMSIVSSNDMLLAKIIFQRIRGVNDQDTLKLHRIHASILIQFKDIRENEVGERNP